MDNVDETQDLSFSPQSRMAHSYSPPAPFIRNGIRYNEFREILNTAVQATQHDRPMQRQPEVLGKLVFRLPIYKMFFFLFLETIIIESISLIRCRRYIC